MPIFSSRPTAGLPTDAFLSEADVVRLAPLFDALGIGVVLQDGADGVRLASPLAREFFGLDLPPPDRAVFDLSGKRVDPAAALWANGNDTAAWSDLSLRAVSTEGLVLSLLTRSFRDLGGAEPRVLSFVLDISEHRRLEDELAERTAKLAAIQPRDGLTGLYNRRHMLERLGEEIHRARRYGTPFTMALIDVDDLEGINAKHGRAGGDLVLLGIARTLQQALRELDLIGRIGGEEFMVVLPNVRQNDALLALERARLEIASTPYGETGIRATVTGGVAEYWGEEPQAMLTRVSDLVRRAKDEGRDRLTADGDIV